MRLLLVVALLAGGCSLAPTDQVLAQLAQSDRTWCLSVNTIYGTLKVGGTGLSGGKAICNQEGWVVDSAPAAAPVAAPAGGVIVLPAPPRVLQQEPHTYREVIPQLAPVPERVPERVTPRPSAFWQDVLDRAAGR